MLLYKARNFTASLTNSETSAWEQYRQDYLLAGGENSRLAHYLNKIEEVKKQTKLTKQQKYILEELQLYGESLMPAN